MCFQSLHRRAFEYGALANGLRKWDADETTDGAQPLPPTVQQRLGQPAAHFRNIFQEVSFSAAALQNLDQEQRDVAEALVRAAGCVHALWSSAGAGKTTFWPCVSWNGRTNPTLQP